MMREASIKSALVLSGGGARAAYEVGVLTALRQIMPQPQRNPFPIYCGRSGGAVNAASLALAADDFGAGVDQLEAFWSELHSASVYRVDSLRDSFLGGRWLRALISGGLSGVGQHAWLDNAPLRQSLSRRFDFTRLEGVIAARSLRALSITCSGYGSGQSVSFFQGRADLDPWQKTQRVGAHVALNIEHVMASMAMPFLFPPVRLHREYFGDGAMRELAVLSPAVHLGADRILVIGTDRMATGDHDRATAGVYPSLADTAGHVLSGVYVDRLSADIERMGQVNRLVARIPEETRRREGIPWRPIDLMVIEPSERLDLLAADLIGTLPQAVRGLMRHLGARDNSGSAFASYLMFEAAYARRLIDLGYRDAMVRRGELAAFLDLDRA